jgi:hypothetical protein
VKTERTEERRGEGRGGRREGGSDRREEKRRALREGGKGTIGGDGTRDSFTCSRRLSPDSQAITDCSGSLSGQRDISDFVSNLTVLESTELPP